MLFRSRGLHEAAKTGKCPYLLVRYEDIKRDQVGELSRIFAFLGLPAEPESLEGFGKPVMENGIPRPSTLRKGIVGEWRRWLTAEDREIIRSECGELMELFGYENRE